MRKLLGTVLGAAVLALGWMPVKADAAPCSGFTTITALAAAGECQTGDKNLDFVSGTIPGTTTFTFNAVTADLYILSLNFGAGVAAPASFTLNYIISTTDPTQTITSVSLDSNVQPLPPTVTGGSTVVKNVSTCSDATCTTPVAFDTLTSTNGNTDVSNPGLSSRFVQVNETFTVTGGQTLLDASNAFTQATVGKIPEPASMLLFGLGLIGLGAWGKKRLGK